MVTLAAVAGIVVYGLYTQPSAPAALGSGNLPRPAAPLSKPEPADLLTRSGLVLTDGQVKAIRAIDSAWRSDKGKLLAAMDAYRPGRGRVDEIARGLDGYSQLSRQFDSRRAGYWASALAVLSASQRKEIHP